MTLDRNQILALDKAETLTFHSDFCPYLELKALMKENGPDAERKFRSLFTSYYGLNVGGVTEEFRDTFFTIMHNVGLEAGGEPDYKGILLKLYSIKRRKGDFALPFSFVSKLVAMHCEESPIYDRHVLSFFGLKPPGSTMPRDLRIRWFIDCLGVIRDSYIGWMESPTIGSIITRLRSRDPQLKDCHVVRLMDFLVWKVGNQKLLSK